MENETLKDAATGMRTSSKSRRSVPDSIRAIAFKHHHPAKGMEETLRDDSCSEVWFAQPEKLPRPTFPCELDYNDGSMKSMLGMQLWCGGLTTYPVFLSL
ncbi:hypothetical protein EST38_g2104 [Candolleomyces aberdarensis]|uniref:Uncharacterized protein n=1 Tax=Candolleomyces aberdarensis TaxID=2316362 RepID=A0A4Q2DWV7_9AGAR|nr:hypothetical protein EST38_g2104 [Candolleomyces aberdarensis]